MYKVPIKSKCTFFVFASLFLFAQKDLNAQSSLKLWYDKPASQWVESLPIGNGRIGVMTFGGIEEELIQLNESTLYSGGPVKKNVNPEAKKYFPQIREALLKEENYAKADQLARKMQELFTESYINIKGGKKERAKSRTRLPH